MTATPAATGINAFSLEDDRDDTELSHQLLPEFSGRGLASEAAAALLAWVGEPPGRLDHRRKPFVEPSILWPRDNGFVPDTQFAELSPEMVSAEKRPTGASSVAGWMLNSARR